MEYSEYAKARDLKGYTDYKVAKETGITPSTFSDWKNGRCKPKGEKLKKIASVLDMDMQNLYSMI